MSPPCTPSVPISPPCTLLTPPHLLWVAMCRVHPVTLGAPMFPPCTLPTNPIDPGCPWVPPVRPSAPRTQPPVSPCSKPVYTVLVVLLFASITFPPGLGQFMASRVSENSWGSMGTPKPPSLSGGSGCPFVHLSSSP